MLRPPSPRALWLAALASFGCSEVAQVLDAKALGGQAGSGVTTGGSAGLGGSSSGGQKAMPAGAAGEGGQSTPDPQPELGLSLSAGQVHACLAKAGLVYCWGDNRDGQLGGGDTLEHPAPVLVKGAANIVQVAAGERHTCVLDAEGAVSCFGSNLQGQLGQATNVGSASSPLLVTLPGPAAYLDVSYLHSCAILTSGKLYCWGENVETQLGQGDAPDENQSTPVSVTDFSDFVSVACGQGHTLALRESGELYGWGRNTTGQIGLGDGMPNRIRVPTLITGATPLASLDAGQDSACGLAKDGSAWCWGSGIEQHLGTFSEDTVLTPRAVAGVPTLTSISLDTFHTCALDEQARLWCFGRAIEGQLGLGDNRSVQPEPAEVPAPSGDGWLAVSAGRFFTCGVTTDERVYCAGENGAGELGTGDTERRNLFTEARLP